MKNQIILLSLQHQVQPPPKGNPSPSHLHAAGEKGLLVQDALIVLHQVVQFVCQLEGQGLQGGWLCAVHHQA